MRKKSFNASDLIALISAIATIIAVIVSMLTLLYLNGQFKTSIQPELMVNNEKAIFIIERYSTNGFIDYYTANLDNEKLNLDSINWKEKIGPESNSFNFNIFNIGSGVAKNIQLNWEYDTLKIIDIFNNNKPFEFIDTIMYNNNVITICNKKDTNYYWELPQELRPKINFILPYSNINKSEGCRLPYLYLKLYSIYRIMKFSKSHNFNEAEEIKDKFPDLKLKICYTDISNNKYEKNYVIHIKDMMLAGDINKLKMTKEIEFFNKESNNNTVHQRILQIFEKKIEIIHNQLLF